MLFKYVRLLNILLLIILYGVHLCSLKRFQKAIRFKNVLLTEKVIKKSLK